MTQPTLGFGADWPRASSPSATARAIHSLSSVNPELLCELLHLPLLLLFGRYLRRLVLLLLGGDLRVGTLGRIEIDLDDLRLRPGDRIGVDDELDHDDRRDQQCEARADQLLAASLAHKVGEVTERRARARRAREEGHASKIRPAPSDRQPACVSALCCSFQATKCPVLADLLQQGGHFRAAFPSCEREAQ